MDTDSVVELLTGRITAYLRDPRLPAEAWAEAGKLVPEAQLLNLRAVLRCKSMSYRDALIIQLAYGIRGGLGLDLTQRQPGARGPAGVAGRLSAFLAEAHINAVKDAFQNIGKNTANLARGNVEEFDALLAWASARATNAQQLTAVFECACAEIASTARPTLQMPPLCLAQLTFPRVVGFLSGLYALGSEGAYEQFAIAALLTATLEQGNLKEYRVETKSLNASDRSSRVAGDVQIVAGNRIVEAYEVTANEWETKMAGAEEAARSHDLSRLHIVARTRKEPYREALLKLRPLTTDVSVLEVEHFSAALVSALTKRYRERALIRLYELLDRYQPDVNRVNAYVRALADAELALRATPGVQ